MDRNWGRREYLKSLLGGSIGLAGCVDAPIVVHEPPEAVGLDTVIQGLNLPTGIAFHPEYNLQYIATQTGAIYLNRPGERGIDEILDLSSKIVVGREQGLLGICLHPGFNSNGRIFVRYSSPIREATPDEFSHTFVLSEFKVDKTGTRIHTDSERTVLEIPEPQNLHNAGDITFGPDGYLYVATGDGGGPADTGIGHAEDWYERNGGGNGQDIENNLLGSILRIDVDSSGSRYRIPGDNPLVGQLGLNEHWAWGFRNPWRMSFDKGELYVGDVGKWQYEEINHVESGGNYGWNVKEGYSCFNTVKPAASREGCPEFTPLDVRNSEKLIDPVISYPHAEWNLNELHGSAVIGGYVYRGDELPGLFGRYIFGDLAPNGRIFVGSPPLYSGGESWGTTILRLTKAAKGKIRQILSFGRDHRGEVYILAGKGVYRLCPA